MTATSGSSSPGSDSGKILTGKRVLLYLLLFFGATFAVNGYMMKRAIETLPGVAVDSPYEAGQRYNKEIAAAAAQASRSWKVDARVERDPDGRARLQVNARDSESKSLAGLAFTARLEWPADKRRDIPVRLTEREAGIYVGTAEGVQPGRYDLILEAERGGERLFLSTNRLSLN